jgi:hypothetical protein
MQAVANNPKFAKKVGVPTSVGREFTKKEGGAMKESKAMMKKEAGMKKMKSGGLAAGHKQADGVAKKGKTKAMKPKMMGGGMYRNGGKTC